MATFSLILLVAAFVCFVLAALNVPVSKPVLVPLGLACWVLSILLTRG